MKRKMKISGKKVVSSCLVRYSRATFSISEEDPELTENNIAVMELSPEEAEKEAITEVETVLTESEDESQSVSEETEVIEETETNCFKKCVVLN